MSAYRHLLLWQRAMDLAVVLHRNTVAFPESERLGLAWQLRRLALAIPLQVAEHYSQRAATFLIGLRRAHRTLRQLEHQVIMADRLEYWTAQQADEVGRHVAQVRRLLQALLRSLRSCSEF